MAEVARSGAPRLRSPQPRAQRREIHTILLPDSSQAHQVLRRARKRGVARYRSTVLRALDRALLHEEEAGGDASAVSVPVTTSADASSHLCVPHHANMRNETAPIETSSPAAGKTTHISLRSIPKLWFDAGWPAADPDAVTPLADSKSATCGGAESADPGRGHCSSFPPSPAGGALRSHSPQISWWGFLERRPARRILGVTGGRGRLAPLRGVRLQPAVVVRRVRCWKPPWTETPEILDGVGDCPEIARSTTTVGMRLLDPLTIGALNFLIRSAFGHAEDSPRVPSRHDTSLSTAGVHADRADPSALLLHRHCRPRALSWIEAKPCAPALRCDDPICQSRLTSQ